MEGKQKFYERYSSKLQGVSEAKVDPSSTKFGGDANVEIYVGSVNDYAHIFVNGGSPFKILGSEREIAILNIVSLVDPNIKQEISDAISSTITSIVESLAHRRDIVKLFEMQIDNSIKNNPKIKTDAEYRATWINNVLYNRFKPLESEFKQALKNKGLE